MKTAIDDVKQFHRAARAPIASTPGLPSEDRRVLRYRLIREEVDETLRAIVTDDMVEIADGIADSIVVLIGTALEYGIDLEAVWHEVQAANMAKFPGCPTCDGRGRVRGPDPRSSVYFADAGECPDCEGTGYTRIVREDGKVQKPEGWTPPDIASVLRASGWEG